MLPQQITRHHGGYLNVFLPLGFLAPIKKRPPRGLFYIAAGVSVTSLAIHSQFTLTRRQSIRLSARCTTSMFFFITHGIIWLCSGIYTTPVCSSSRAFSIKSLQFLASVSSLMRSTSASIRGLEWRLTLGLPSLSSPAVWRAMYFPLKPQASKFS